MQLSKLFVCLCTLGLAAGMLPLRAQAAGQWVGKVLVPASSIARPEDAGVRAHTNHRIFAGPAGGLGQSGGMDPAQMRSFYGMPATGGQGVIAIVDAYDYPTALNDFNTFSAEYGLPAETSTAVTASTNQVFQIVYATGTRPAGNASWNGEEALDIEWAHALSPGAKIVLVEAASSSFSDLLTAINQAVAIAGVAQVSMSWGSKDFSGEATFDGHFDLNGPLFFASSGDAGGEVDYPSCSPFVSAVGGTSVATSSSGAWTGECAWGDGTAGDGGGGGGTSAYEPKPAWQNAVTLVTGGRGVPDISSNADPSTGLSVYDSTPYEGYEGWMVIGGTSASSPSMAAMVNVSGVAYASTTQFLTALYVNALETPYPFRDITCGSNGFPALVGWDFAAGLGTPLGPGSFAPPITASITTPAKPTVTVSSGTPISFVGLAKDAFPSATITYTWNFGDGSGTGTGASTSHTYTNKTATNAACTVTLTATDNNGASATATCIVTVTPQLSGTTITAPASNETVASGASVSFSGSATDSNASAAISYAWNFGDGSNGGGASASHLFTNLTAANVTYTVALTASDNLGAVSAAATLNITVTPELSATAITAPASNETVVGGASVSFSGSATDTNGSATITYSWNFGDGKSATGAATSHVFTNQTAASIAYTVALTASDSLGATSAAATRIITVTPGLSGTTISAPATNTTVASGAPVSFSGTATDTDGSATITYSWNFGDGSSGSGASASHAFTNLTAASVAYTVTLTASDNLGDVSAPATRIITVTPELSGTAITAPASNVTVASGIPVSFSGTAADSNASAAISYAWNFGDGSSGGGASASHAFTNLTAANVTYTVTLTASDNLGAVSAAATRIITVTPELSGAAITSPASNVTVASGVPVSFSGSAADSNGSATITYSWNFGDGGSATGATASHTFTAPGSYLVTLNVKDNFGAAGTASISLSVPDIVTASITSPAGNLTVTSGATVAFSGSATDSSSAATQTFAWNFGDGGNASGASASHTFTNPTAANVTCTVTLTTTDSTGVTGTATLTVTVTAATISLPSSTVGLLTGTSAVLTATVNGTTNDSVTWSSSSGSTIIPGSPSTSATFSAAAAGSYTVTATAAADGTQATTTVDVHPANFLDATVSGMDVLDLVGSYGISNPAVALTGDAVVSAQDLGLILQQLGW